jgi:hypothetical protein
MNRKILLNDNLSLLYEEIKEDFKNHRKIFLIEFLARFRDLIFIVIIVGGIIYARNNLLVDMKMSK